MSKFYLLLFKKNFFVTCLLLGLVFQLKAQTEIAVGTGTTGNLPTSTGADGYPCPIQDYYEGSRAQYLFLASELSGAGMSAGRITAVKFVVASLGTAGVSEQYTVKIGTTSASTLGSATWEAGATVVYGPVDYQPVAGTNTFSFTTPFNWNGTDNVFVEVCNGDPNNATLTTFTSNPVINWTTGLSFNASHTYRVDGAGTLCNATTTTNTGLQTSRPNTIFEWTPVAACSGTVTGGTTVTSAANVCSGQNFSLSVTGGSLASGLTYQWQRSPNNSAWTDITGATSYMLNTSQTSSYYYRRIVTCGASSANSVAVLVNSPSLIAGTFTINNAAPTGGGNFQTFTEAVDYIKCGISGAVTFNVQPGSGPYNEQVVIPQIFGASPASRVTFNGNGATISFNSANTSLRYGIWLNGADHIVIDSLTIDGSAGTYCWGVTLTNQADSNIIRKCTINNNISSTSANYIGIVLNGSATATAVSANSGNGNIITGNTINGGLYGVYLYGNSASFTQNAGNVISNNIIKEVYNYFVYGIYQTGLVVSGNDLSRPSRTTSGTVAGVYLATNCRGALVEKNRIYNLFGAMASNTSTAYGIYTGSADGTPSLPNRIINNLFYTPGGNGVVYGIYNTDSDTVLAYHNTIVIDDQSATSGAAYGIYQTTLARGVQYRNNIVSVTRSGTGIKRCLYFVTTTSTINSNTNLLYLNAGAGTDNKLGQYGTTSYTTLADWKGANTSAYDQLSISEDPLFANTGMGDYKPSAVNANDIGANVGVSTDILGVARGTSPDPGAYEFGIPACTAPPTPGTATSPSAIVCSGSTVSLSLVGNSIGAGQTYQWQSSDNNTTYTNIGTAGTSSNFSTVQTITKYYRAIVTCGGNSQTSAPVLVTTPPLVTGTFTINNAAATGGGNFQTYAEALASLGCGIGGPVVFNVQPGSGPYNEQITINPIAGASAANTVTFNANGTTISFNSTTSANRTGIVLNGADHIIIDSVIIDGAAGTYAWGVLFTNGADSNTLRRSTILTSTTNTTFENHIPVVMSSSLTSASTSGNSGNYNLITGNTFAGGYYSVVLYGNTTTGSPSKSNVVSNNVMTDMYSYANYLYYQANAVISGNNISRPTRTTSTTVAGAFVSTGCTATLVDGNRIHNLFDAASALTSTTYGIYFSATAVAGQENRAINNLVYNMNGNGAVYGIYNTTSPFCNVYHNTIVLDDQATTTGAAYGIYQTGAAAGLNFRNNIIYVTRGGTGAKRCLYFVTTTSTIISNNNVLFMGATGGTNNHVGQFGTPNFTTLADWKGANTNAYDQASTDADPQFSSPPTGEFKPMSGIVDNLGAAAGVTLDINGVTRDASTPDPGAYEFSTLTAGINAGAISLVTPAAAAKNCYTNAETITVKIRNYSTALLNFATNPVTVSVNVTGPVTQTLTATVNTGTLASNGTLDVVMSSPLNMTTPGVYTFSATTTLAGDVDPGNNAFYSPALRNKAAVAAGTIGSTPPSFCLTGGIPVLNSTGADGYSGVQWQQSTTSGTGFTDIASGTTLPYTVGAAITQNMYYRLVATCGAVTNTSPELLVRIETPQVTSTTPNKTCGPGAVVLNATANAGSTINWYTTSAGGSPVGSGNSYTTPVINTSTTYYASALTGAGIVTAGRTVPFASSTGFNGADYGIVFDATVPFTLQSVDVFPTSANTVTIQLTTSTGTVLQTTGAISIPTGTGTTPYTVTLNFAVPAGTSLYLKTTAHTGNIIRDNPITGTFSYPLPIGTVGNMTAGLLAGGANTNTYYYFYNWQVLAGCETARVPVLATVDSDPNCTLPVSLVDFNGSKSGAVNLLDWTTVSETNNTGFELERSADGIRFSKLAFVASKAPNGNSTRSITYNFTDVAPLAANGWYRLKQIDKDGRSAYSKTVLIQRSRGVGGLITGIYPNPASQELNVVVVPPVAGALRLMISDVTGKLVMQVPVSNAVNGNAVKISVQQLAAGAYTIKAVCSDGCEGAVYKFIKQ